MQKSLIFLPILIHAINSAIIPLSVIDQEETNSRPGFLIIGLLRGSSATFPTVNEQEYRALIDGLFSDKEVEENAIQGPTKALMRAQIRHQPPRRFSFLDPEHLMGGGFVPSGVKRFSRIGGNIMMGRK